MKHQFSKPQQKALAGGLVAGLCLTGAAFAQTVTVDPTGTADGTTVFNTLQDAVDSFATGGANEANSDPNVINLRNDHGAITGSLLAIKSDPTDSAPITTEINDDITIQGVDGTGADAMAVFAGVAIPSSDQTLRSSALPCIAWRQAGTLTFKNIAFVPADPAGGTEMKSFMVIKSPGVPDENLTVNISNCVFTSNDGTGNPITTTGRPEDDAKLNDAGVISMPAGSAGIWAFSRSERGDLTLNVTDTVFASFTPLTGINPRAEAFKVWQSGPTQNLINCFLNINEGCVFANIDGNVGQISWNSKITMNGTEENPIIVRSLHNTGSPAMVWLNYVAADVQPVLGEFNWVRFYDCYKPAIIETGERAFVTSVKNTIIADGLDDGIVLSSGLDLGITTGDAPADITIDNVVIHNVGSGGTPSGIYGNSTSARNVNVTNSFFTDSDATMTGVNSGTATGTWTVSSSVLSLNGSSALAAQTAGSVITDGTVTDSEVTYINTDDPFSPDFYKPVGAGVNDWSVY